MQCRPLVQRRGKARADREANAAAHRHLRERMTQAQGEAEALRNAERYRQRRAAQAAAERDAERRRQREREQCAALDDADREAEAERRRQRRTAFDDAQREADAERQRRAAFEDAEREADAERQRQRRAAFDETEREADAERQRERRAAFDDAERAADADRQQQQRGALEQEEREVGRAANATAQRKHRGRIDRAIVVWRRRCFVRPHQVAECDTGRHDSVPALLHYPVESRSRHPLLCWRESQPRACTAAGATGAVDGRRITSTHFSPVCMASEQRSVSGFADDTRGEPNRLRVRALRYHTGQTIPPCRSAASQGWRAVVVRPDIRQRP